MDIVPGKGWQGGFQFRVIDAEKREVLKDLSHENTERVTRRLYEMVESMTKTEDA